MNTENGQSLFSKHHGHVSAELRMIAEKVYNHIRISGEDAMQLYQSNNLGFLGELAHYVRVNRHGLHTYFNRNFHIEPTNICIYTCSFCSFARRPDEEGGWEY